MLKRNYYLGVTHDFMVLKWIRVFYVAKAKLRYRLSKNLMLTPKSCVVVG